MKFFSGFSVLILYRKTGKLQVFVRQNLNLVVSVCQSISCLTIDLVAVTNIAIILIHVLQLVISLPEDERIQKDPLGVTNTHSSLLSIHATQKSGWSPTKSLTCLFLQQQRLLQDFFLSPKANVYSNWKKIVMHNKSFLYFCEKQSFLSHFKSSLFLPTL